MLSHQMVTMALRAWATCPLWCVPYRGWPRRDSSVSGCWRTSWTATPPAGRSAHRQQTAARSPPGRSPRSRSRRSPACHVTILAPAVRAGRLTR